MAHGLVTSRDFQVGLEPAWHGLTQIVPAVTRECFPEIVQSPLYYGDDAKPLSVGGKPYFVPVSSDDGKPVAPPFSPDSYTLFTPHQAWDWITSLLAGTGFTVKSCGMIWDRSQWFLGIELTELRSVADEICQYYLNASGGLDRSMSPSFELAGLFPVCANTLNISRMTGEILFRSKATKKFTERREAASAEVEKAVGMARVFKAQLSKLQNAPCSIEQASRIYAGYLGLDTIPVGSTEPVKELSTRSAGTLETLKTLFVSGRGNAGQTEADVLNGYTELYTRGNVDSPRYDASKAWVSGEFGGNADKKATFANLMVERTCYAADHEWSLDEVADYGKTLIAAL